MGENNSAAGMKKADLLILKVDRLAKQTATVDAKVTAVVNSGAKTNDKSDIIAKLVEENEEIKQELKYLAAQSESVYTGLTKLFEKLSAELEGIKKSPAGATSNIDMDELSSRVAEKIIIPATSVDINYDELADRICERLNLNTANNAEEPQEKVTKVYTIAQPDIDYDELGAKIVSNLYIPKAISEEIDYDTLSEKIAEKLPADKINVVASSSETPANAQIVTPEIDYDELGTKIVTNMYIPKAIAEDIDYDTLSDKIAEKVTFENKNGDVAKTDVTPEIDYDELTRRIVEAMPKNTTVDYDVLSTKVAEKVSVSDRLNVVAPIRESYNATSSPVVIDYDELGSKIVSNLYIPKAIVEEIDYDLLAEKVSKAMPSPEVISPDYIASKVAEQIVIPQAEVPEVKPAEELDIESLSRKIADKIAVPVADVPEVVVDEDRIAYAVAEKLLANKEDAPVSADIDEEKLADALAERLNVSLSDEVIADAVVKNLSNVIDSQEIADCVAKQVGSVSPEQFDIMIDDDGCDSLAKSVIEKLDYDYIAYSVSEKLNTALMAGSPEIDTEELAKNISEKISVNATVNEDVLADKAAAVLSNYLPEIDTDEIADKVVAGVIPAIPPATVFDYDNISNTVTERIVESQEDKDFDIVIDDEGLTRISEGVSSEIKEEYSKRFDGIDGEVENLKGEFAGLKDELAEVKGNVANITDDVANINGEVANIKTEIENIKSLIESHSSEHKEESSARLDNIESEVNELKNIVQSGELTKSVEDSIEELKKLILSGVVISSSTKVAEKETNEVEKETAMADSEENEESEELVTVSDIVPEEELEEIEKLEEEEEQEDKANEFTSNVKDEVIEEIVEDINENPTEDEIMPDGFYGIANDGVDFINMMKYNRSFIARIIQGSDEVKNYYGEVKSNLLSYKKVNSNIAWGAERFNKGRETIARFKIRGKTLCLYLALDPKEYKESVYHHSDVSDNKSMRGTPMMVKIKSPLGVKKAVRLIDEMLAKRNGIKQEIKRRDYAAMYPYESIDELIEDGLVKDVSKK